MIKIPVKVYCDGYMPGSACSAALDYEIDFSEIKINLNDKEITFPFPWDKDWKEIIIEVGGWGFGKEDRVIHLCPTCAKKYKR